jgi:molybdate transport system permease protein
MGFPLMVRAIRISMEAHRHEPRSGGAYPWCEQARRVLYRNAAADTAGSVDRRAAFVRAQSGEFGATITFVSNIPGETRTLPLAIYTQTQVPGGDAQALRLSVISVVLSLLALIASELLVRRASRRAKGQDA